jgi:hypothetical protein
MRRDNAGTTTRQALAQELVASFQWPGTLDQVPKYPGRLAFALGVEIRHCRDCARLNAEVCERYDVLSANERVNCKSQDST